MSGQFSDVGIVGLRSAGRSFALLLAAKGLRVSLWDASPECAEEFVSRQDSTRGGLVGYADCDDFVESLNTPRRVAVFETGTSAALAQLRELLRETDRLVEYPWQEQDVTLDDLTQLELTLVFQMA